MDKLAAYEMVLSESPLWDDESLEKLALTREDLAEAKQKALIAGGLHGLGHFGPGVIATIPAGYVQRSALRDAGIDYEAGGEGTFGAKHPIISGLLPVAGTVSAYNASQRIGRKMRDME